MKSFVQKYRHQIEYKVIGLMSGTSEDGVDLCFSKYYIENGRWNFEILTAETIPYKKAELELLKWAYAGRGTNINKFDSEFGEILASKLSYFIAKHDLNPDFICSHGHTIFHRPEKGITVQIGNGQIIANKCGVPVINNFRSLDVELGGQGAPLVPIGDELLFKNYKACLNLGGFSNISFYQKKRIAFDISPANLPLNKLAKEHFDVSYDSGGALARKGKVNLDLLNALNNLEYYKLNPPKSLGVEWLEAEFWPIVAHYKEVSKLDKLSTIVEHIAVQISAILNSISASNCLITGGGAFNDYLIDRIQALADTELYRPTKELIDFKEALIFGLLGILKVRGENNTLKSVTGASKDSSGGDLYIPR